MLREHGFLPIRVRLELKASAAPLTRQLHQSVRDAIQADVPDAVLPLEEESLWEYLHRTDFELWSPRNYPLTPVIVLDQFEELFTLGERVPDLVDEFRDEFGDLAENRIPADLATRIDNDEELAGRFDLRSRNYKLLISLREDFLPDLEGWCRLIPTLGRSRVRLLPLRAGQALEAVHKPAAHLMTRELAQRVVRIVAGEDLHPRPRYRIAGWRRSRRSAWWRGSRTRAAQLVLPRAQRGTQAARTGPVRRAAGRGRQTRHAVELLLVVRA